ncbi:GNAT family N-acetyltransferase [Talaromyces pinophilus]|uniref:GNAT family N-acetyltransferase n=1 Tax=Talaromyces pinophilus TaxID=128442 RepID=A0A0B8N3E4_TALPI|nr:GNAT family N-acetyltransferase [Talaromyces pinophilus]
MATYTIRDAKPSDLPQIRAVNIHYILNTVLTFRQTPPPPSTILAKYNDIKAHHLPFLVAIDTSLKHKNDNEDDSDLVLGYAYLSPYRGEMLSYASTVELTLFIHPDHQSKSIGSKLLASILQAAESVLHRGFEFGGMDDETATKVIAGENGLGVFVRNVLAVMAVDTDGPDEGDKLRRWYIERGIDTVFLQYSINQLGTKD